MFQAWLETVKNHKKQNYTKNAIKKVKITRENFPKATPLENIMLFRKILACCVSIVFGKNSCMSLSLCVSVCVRSVLDFHTVPCKWKVPLMRCTRRPVTVAANRIPIADLRMHWSIIKKIHSIYCDRSIDVRSMLDRCSINARSKRSKMRKSSSATAMTVISYARRTSSLVYKHF